GAPAATATATLLAAEANAPATTPAAVVLTGGVQSAEARPTDAPAAVPACVPEPPPWDAFAEYDRLTNPLLENATPIARARVLFGRGELIEFKRQPQKKEEIMAQLAKDFQPEDFSPILLGRVGDYRKEHGDAEGARVLYEKL